MLVLHVVTLGYSLHRWTDIHMHFQSEWVHCIAKPSHIKQFDTELSRMKQSDVCATSDRVPSVEVRPETWLTFQCHNY